MSCHVGNSPRHGRDFSELLCREATWAAGLYRFHLAEGATRNRCEGVETSEIQPPQLVDGLMKGWSFAECPDVMPVAFEFIVGASRRSLGTVGGGRGNPKVTKIGR